MGVGPFPAGTVQGLEPVEFEGGQRRNPARRHTQQSGQGPGPAQALGALPCETNKAYGHCSVRAET